MMQDWKKLPLDPRDQRSVDRKRACNACDGGEATKIEETLTKQENALALDQHTLTGAVIERYKQKKNEEREELIQ